MINQDGPDTDHALSNQNSNDLNTEAGGPGGPSEETPAASVTSETAPPELSEPAPIEIPEWDPVAVFGDAVPEPSLPPVPAEAVLSQSLDESTSSVPDPLPPSIEMPMEMPSWEPEEAFAETGPGPSAKAPGITESEAIEMPMEMPSWDPVAEFAGTQQPHPEAITQPERMQETAVPMAEPPALPPPPLKVTVASQAARSTAPVPVPASAKPVAYPGLDQVISEIDTVMRAGKTQLLDGPVTTGATMKFQTVTGEKHIVFTLAGTRYAVPLQHILEMDRVPGLTPVPNVPTWVLGVTNLRGDILAIIDLRTFLEMPGSEAATGGRLLVARSLSNDALTGLIVDRVNGLEAIPTEEIQPPSRLLEGKITSFLRGVYNRENGMVVVLDLERFFQSPEIRQFEAA